MCFSTNGSIAAWAALTLNFFIPRMMPGDPATSMFARFKGKLQPEALDALREAFGHEPVMLREGGSIPIITEFKNVLGADSLLLGLALPDDNLHSPNEKFDLDCFHNGAEMSARLWPKLAAA